MFPRWSCFWGCFVLEWKGTRLNIKSTFFLSINICVRRKLLVIAGRSSMNEGAQYQSHGSELRIPWLLAGRHRITGTHLHLRIMQSVVWGNVCDFLLLMYLTLYVFRRITATYFLKFTNIINCYAKTWGACGDARQVSEKLFAMLNYSCNYHYNFTSTQSWGYFYISTSVKDFRHWQKLDWNVEVTQAPIKVTECHQANCVQIEDAFSI